MPDSLFISYWNPVTDTVANDSTQCLDSVSHGVVVPSFITSGFESVISPMVRVTHEVLAGWNRPIPKGFLKGYLDLVFRRDGYFYVIDWKSNRLNGQATGFTAEGVRAEMAKEGYFFQYLLYSVVLHRFLKETMGAGYSWDRNFGGVRYYFLRGIAAGGEAPVFVDRPSEAVLDKLSTALGLEG